MALKRNTTTVGAEPRDTSTPRFATKTFHQRYMVQGITSVKIEKPSAEEESLERYRSNIMRRPGLGCPALLPIPKPGQPHYPGQCCGNQESPST